MKQNFYIISVCGYETYSPIWLMSDLNRERFRSLVEKSIDKAVNDIIKEEDYSYIDGHDIIDKLIEILSQNNINQVKIEEEIGLDGECLYTEDNSNHKPEIFSKEAWGKIIKHNTKVDEKRRERLKQRKNDNPNKNI